jgi:monoamine oxidase
MEELMAEDYDCIVLGAGMAGVTAARELKSAGKKVLLLEASGMAGGRMRSKEDFVLTNDGSAVRPGFPVEEGADWIHVEDDGSYELFWKEIRRHGFKGEEFPKSDHNRVAFPDWVPPFTAADAFLRSAGLQKMAQRDNGLFGKIRDFDLSGEDLPAGQFVAGLGYKGKALSMAYYSISAHTPGFLDTHPQAPFPPAADDISVAGLKVDRIPQQLRYQTSEFEMRTGKNEICGYNRLPQAIVEQFTRVEPGQTPGTVLYNQEVVKVEANGNGVRVRTNQNRGGFTAASVICTFSVGVLNPISGLGEAIFGPQFLPPAKRDALQIVKMGKITKFMMQFKEWVWRPARPGFEMGVVSHAEGAARREPRTFFCSFPTQKNGPYILAGLFMGVDQVILENIPDDRQAAEFVFRVIERLYNDTPSRPWSMEDKLVWRTLPDGTRMPNVYRKDWGQDAWTRGGNSYISYAPGRTIAEITGAREALKSPLETLPVFWAGEATAPAYRKHYQPLSVHGAFISGMTVAEDVIWYLNNPGQDFTQHYRQKYKL